MPHTPPPSCRIRLFRESSTPPRCSTRGSVVGDIALAQPNAVLVTAHCQCEFWIRPQPAPQPYARAPSSDPPFHGTRRHGRKDRPSLVSAQTMNLPSSYTQYSRTAYRAPRPFLIASNTHRQWLGAQFISLSRLSLITMQNDRGDSSLNCDGQPPKDAGSATFRVWKDRNRKPSTNVRRSNLSATYSRRHRQNTH